ncbi:MAG TPA: spore coat U domain-containing protein [Gemmatimonadales bacterium]|nr:spore coat U domain-containing protein [Gemmatimonadales bacterium]
MKLRVALLAAFLCAGGAGSLLAATSTTTFTVSAAVAANCTISVTPINMGNYDPVVTNATNPVSASGTLTITCTKGTGPTIGLNGGNHAGAVSGVTRAMANGTNMLGYELYQPASAPGNGGVWTDIGGANPLNAGVTPSKAPRSYVVNATIPGGQDASVGSYSDTITATVNF